MGFLLNNPLEGSQSNILLSVMRPRAPRWQAPYVPGERVADYKRLFAYYIDLVQDEDFSLQKDPKAHERMMRDGQISGALRIRQLATASRRIIFTPLKQSPEHSMYAEATADLWSRLQRPGEFLLQVLEAIPRGLSVQELQWDLDSNLRFFVNKTYPVDKSRFRFDLDNRLTLISPIDVFYGEYLPNFMFMPHRFDPEPGPFEMPNLESRLAFGRGLFDRLWVWFYWKQLVLRFSLRFAEVFAAPFKVGRHPANNPEAQSLLLDQLSRLESNSEIVLPSGKDWDVSFIQAPTRGNNTYQWLLEYLDNQILKIILGTTLIMEPGSVGSYSLGQSHERTTFGRIAAFDSDSLCDTLRNTFIRWMFHLNGWPEDFMPKVSQSAPETGSIAETVDTYIALSEAGYPISVEMVSEATGIRTMRPGETALVIDPMSGVILDSMGNPVEPPIESGETSEGYPPSPDKTGGPTSPQKTPKVAEKPPPSRRMNRFLDRPNGTALSPDQMMKKLIALRGRGD